MTPNKFYQRLNTYWRVLATGSSFLLFGVGAFFFGLVFLLLVAPLPIAKSRKQRAIRQTISRACRAYLSIMRSLRLLSFSINTNNIQPIASHLIIANHPTLLDAIFVLSAFDNICCIVKEDLWKNPLTSIIVTLAGYIPNNSISLVEQATHKLNSNDNILIFPEGTRNTCDGQLEFRRGAANIAVIANCPILPIVIHCFPRTLQKHEKWYQVPVSAPHFSLQTHAVIDISKCIDITKPRTVQYRHLTRFLCDWYRSKLADTPAAKTK